MSTGLQVKLPHVLVSEQTGCIACSGSNRIGFCINHRKMFKIEYQHKTQQQRSGKIPHRPIVPLTPFRWLLIDWNALLQPRQEKQSRKCSLSLLCTRIPEMQLLMQIEERDMYTANWRYYTKLWDTTVRMTTPSYFICFCESYRDGASCNAAVFPQFGTSRFGTPACRTAHNGLESWT